jgi:hypothetical protein
LCRTNFSSSASKSPRGSICEFVMRLVRFPFICAAAALVILTCCGRPHPNSVQEAVERVPINGQVFITTRGGKNIRLGQITVFATALKRFRDLHIADLLESKARSLNQEFTAAKQLGEQREALVRDVKSAYAMTSEERMRFIAALPAANRLHERYDVVLSEIKMRDTQLDKCVAALKEIGTNSYRECEQIAAEAVGLTEAVAISTYEQLTPGSESSKTDADGRFHFDFVPEDELVIFTRGHRYLPSGEAETYQWFVQVHTAKHVQPRILLTNNNSIEGPASENLFSEAIITARSVDFRDIPTSEDRSLPARAKLPPEPRWAPPHVFHLLRYVSVTTKTGVVGLPPGSEIHEHRRDSQRIFGESRGVECEADFGMLTDNLELAEQVQKADFNEQSHIASWQAQQQELERLMRDEDNRRADETHARIEETYKRIHSLTGESRLNEPTHR